MRLGKVYSEQNAAEESLDSNICPLPDFSEWFGRDIAGFPYRKQKLQEITDRRSFFGGELFVDKLIGLFAIPTVEYPPKNGNSLESLVRSILEFEQQNVTLKHCLVFFI
jgi:hypothetical protein